MQFHTADQRSRSSHESIGKSQISCSQKAGCGFGSRLVSHGGTPNPSYACTTRSEWPKVGTRVTWLSHSVIHCRSCVTFLYIFCFPGLLTNQDRDILIYPKELPVSAPLFRSSGMGQNCLPQCCAERFRSKKGPNCGSEGLQQSENFWHIPILIAGVHLLTASHHPILYLKCLCWSLSCIYQKLYIYIIPVGRST